MSSLPNRLRPHDSTSIDSTSFSTLRPEELGASVSTHGVPHARELPNQVVPNQVAPCEIAAEQPVD